MEGDILKIMVVFTGGTIGSYANGEYISAIRFNDVRGDVFNTGVVGFDMANGAVRNTVVNEDFRAK